jgi:hypothetical protein
MPLSFFPNNPENVLNVAWLTFLGGIFGIAISEVLQYLSNILNVKYVKKEDFDMLKKRLDDAGIPGADGP